MIVRHKVAVITVVPSPYQRDLFRAMAERDEIDLSVHYMEATAPDSPWPEVPLRHFERIMPGSWMAFRGARVHLNWALPDLSQADFVVLNSFTSLTAQWLMRRGFRNKRWIFWGEVLRTQPSGWRQETQKRLLVPLSRATAIVGIGRQAEADYGRRFPNVPHFCIPYHCDISAFLEAPRSSGEGRPLRYLFCGQMISRKGVDVLLAAFDRLVNAGLAVELSLVGREADLPAFLSRLTEITRSKIRYEGFQAPEKLHEYFSTADVFVLPSRHDGWGVVVNQALGAGLPVIVSNAVGAGRDLVEDGVNGLLCEAGNVQSLQRAMETMASNPSLVRRFGEASRENARAITPEAGAEKWIRVLDTLTAIPQNRAA